MASGYAQQSIIHSKHSRVQRKPGQYTLGRLIKGNLAAETTRIFRGKSRSNSKQIIREIEYLPKTKANIDRKMNKTAIISSQDRNMEHIVFMESAVFPSIYFKKTTLRNVLKEFVFPENVKALPPSDNRTPLIYQIVSNLFNEINFYIFHILIGENHLTNSFFIFFSDSETIPYSKCCNAPVYIELTENGSGKVLCNSNKCQSPNLAEFLINFEDGRKLWRNLRYFADASEKDRGLRERISKLINNGKYKKMNLIGVVQQTSKQIVQLFYNSKRHRQQQIEMEQQDGPNPFLTGNNYQHRQIVTPPIENQQQQQQLQQQPAPSDDASDVDLRNITNNAAMSKTYYEYQSKMSEGLVNEGKVFHKDFGLIRKIDSHMLDKKRTKNTTRLNFPRIMSEFHKQKRSLSQQNSSISEIKNMMHNLPV